MSETLHCAEDAYLSPGGWGEPHLVDGKTQPDKRGFIAINHETSLREQVSGDYHIYDDGTVYFQGVRGENITGPRYLIHEKYFPCLYDIVTRIIKEARGGLDEMSPFMETAKTSYIERVAQSRPQATP